MGDRVAVEVHKGCGRCDNCIKGMYTACLNYGKVAKGHRAWGFTVDGGYAEYAINHVNTMHKLPDNVSFEESTIITTAGTVLYGLDSIGGYIAGETVAIVGPGPIGLMAVQVCKALCADKVILIGTRDARLNLGKQFGADHLVNVKNEDAVKKVLELTGGAGVDLAIDAAGGPGHAGRLHPHDQEGQGSPDPDLLRRQGHGGHLRGGANRREPQHGPWRGRAQPVARRLADTPGQAAACSP